MNKRPTLLLTGLLALLAACGQQTTSTPQASTGTTLRAQAILSVTTTENSGPGSLREAITNANATAGADTITFGATGTITLQSQLPTVTDALTISGPGADKLTLSGNGAVRVLEVSGTELTLDGVTITRGNATNDSGGGINVINAGTLTLTNSTLSGNSARFGGGISNAGGTVTVMNSTLSGNRVGLGDGGAIDTRGVLTVINSTLSGNRAGLGGGINNGGGPATVLGSTLNGNEALGSGSAIRSENGVTTLQNTVIAFSPLGTCSRSVIDQGGNLNYNSSIEGIPDSSCPGPRADPRLGPLQDNGGPTFTHALLPGSPAIDAGVAPCLDTDQRGVPRPQGATCDIGAFEADLSAPSVTVEQASGQADPTSTLPVVFTATFSENVSGFSASDVSLAGTANLGGASVTVSGGPRVYTLSVGGVSGSGTVSASISANAATDAAGNGNTVSVSTDNTVTYAVPDTTAPTISLTSPAQGATYTLGQPVNAAYTCTDEGSGVASCVGTVASGAAIDTAVVGTGTFTVNATDTAGNTATRTATYTVAYPFRGFLQPVDNLPTINTVKAGSSVPVKFSLGGYRGLNILAAGSPSVRVVPCDGSAPADEIEQTLMTSNSALSYDAATDTYSYVWKTEKSWAGTCRQLNVVLADGTPHLASFRFR